MQQGHMATPAKHDEKHSMPTTHARALFAATIAPKFVRPIDTTFLARAQAAFALMPAMGGITAFAALRPAAPHTPARQRRVDISPSEPASRHYHRGRGHLAQA